MQSFLTAVAGIVILTVFWFGVQTVWRRSDPDAAHDDPLAGRLGCMGCDCLEVCEKEASSAPAEAPHVNQKP
jgi:hypothetical protein